MSRKNKAKPSEQEIDRIVIMQADDDSAWEKPVPVKRTMPAMHPKLRRASRL